MTNKDDGGPAFPLPDQYTPHGDPVMQGSNGMSLRDWFAGQALAGIYAGTDADSDIWSDKNWAVLLAKEAYQMADAMIAARSNGEG